jgi:hypothetical protein
MMKMAAQAPQIVSSNPKLHAGVFQISDGDLFSKTSAPYNKWTSGQLAAILGTAPLSLMYSAHLRGEEEKGEALGLAKKLIADHPWITMMGSTALMREIVKNPKIKKLVSGKGK